MQRRALLRSMVMGGAGTLLHVTSPSLAKALAGGAGSMMGINNLQLSGVQREMCRQLSELIIPTTDTPGAIAAGVPDFIEMMVSDWYTATEREIFLQGLSALEEDCFARHSKSFLDIGEEKKIAALSRQEDLAASYVKEDEGFFLMPKEDEKAPFFDKLKELVVVGYYQSEVGATQELSYNPMPMEYRDIPVTLETRQWSS